MADAVEPNPLAYASFNEFFTRALRPDARPIDRDAGALVSPVDGTVSQLGPLDGSRLLQAKGVYYTVGDLLDGREEYAAQFAGGAFATLYLAPYNYHRIHMPLAGTLRAAWYVPGDLFSVNATTAASVAGLFARNERVVCIFENGPLTLRHDPGRRSVRRQHGNGVAWRDHAAASAARRRSASRPEARAARAGARAGDGPVQHGLHRHPAVAARNRAAGCLLRSRVDGARRAGDRAHLHERHRTWRPTATRAALERRARMLEQARSFFAERSVLEVDTPIVVNAPVTDVHIHSAEVRFPGVARRYFLHTSPEYAMKRLLAAGSGDIFQICHVVRGLERGRLHNAEFTLIEWYRAGLYARGADGRSRGAGRRAAGQPATRSSASPTARPSCASCRSIRSRRASSS